jgi:hypothetical protein
MVSLSIVLSLFCSYIKVILRVNNSNLIEFESYLCCTGAQHDYCNDLDLRKPLDRHFYSGMNVDCVSIQDSPDLTSLQDQCAKFLSQFSRCGEL